MPKIRNQEEQIQNLSQALENNTILQNDLQTLFQSYIRTNNNTNEDISTFTSNFLSNSNNFRNEVKDSVVQSNDTVLAETFASSLKQVFVIEADKISDGPWSSQIVNLRKGYLENLKGIEKNYPKPEQIKEIFEELINENKLVANKTLGHNSKITLEVKIKSVVRDYERNYNIMLNTKNWASLNKAFENMNQLLNGSATRTKTEGDKIMNTRKATVKYQETEVIHKEGGTRTYFRLDTFTGLYGVTKYKQQENEKSASNFTKTGATVSLVVPGGFIVGVPMELMGACMDDGKLSWKEVGSITLEALSGTGKKIIGIASAVNNTKTILQKADTVKTNAYEQQFSIALQDSLKNQNL